MHNRSPVTLDQVTRCNARGVAHSGEPTGNYHVLSASPLLLTFAYTCVSAGPSLSGSPLRMMVSEPESRGGISTDTPVVSRISCRVLPFGPMMYLCWDFFTSTEMVVVFLFCRADGEKIRNDEWAAWKKRRWWKEGRQEEVSKLRSTVKDEWEHNRRQKEEWQSGNRRDRMDESWHE